MAEQSRPHTRGQVKEVGGQDSWSALAEPSLERRDSFAQVDDGLHDAIGQALSQVRDSLGSVGCQREGRRDHAQQRFVVALANIQEQCRKSDAFRRNLVDELARTAGVRVDRHPAHGNGGVGMSAPRSIDQTLDQVCGLLVETRRACAQMTPPKQAAAAYTPTRKDSNG